MPDADSVLDALYPREAMHTYLHQDTSTFDSEWPFRDDHGLEVSFEDASGNEGRSVASLYDIDKDVDIQPSQLSWEKPVLLILSLDSRELLLTVAIGCDTENEAKQLANNTSGEVIEAKIVDLTTASARVLQWS